MVFKEVGECLEGRKVGQPRVYTSGPKWSCKKWKKIKVGDVPVCSWCVHWRRLNAEFHVEQQEGESDAQR